MEENVVRKPIYFPVNHMRKFTRMPFKSLFFTVLSLFLE